MSDAAILAMSLSEIAAQRSAFKPVRYFSLRAAEPAAVVDEYARGLADGQQLAVTAFTAEKDALLALVTSAQALKPEAGPELSALLRKTVVRLVAQICDRITIDADFLEAQIARAVAVITEADEARQIMVHPDDAALLGQSVHSLAVRSDPGMARGMIRIDCSQGWIEHGVPLGLERLRDMFGGDA